MWSTVMILLSVCAVLIPYSVKVQPMPSVINAVMCSYRHRTTLRVCLYRPVILCRRLRFVVHDFWRYINLYVCMYLPSVLLRCWLGGRKGIQPVSCFSKIHIGFTFLVPAHPGSPEKRAVKRVVCNVWENRNIFSVDLKVDRVTQLSTVLGSEFQTAGAEQRKACLA